MCMSTPDIPAAVPAPAAPQPTAKSVEAGTKTRKKARTAAGGSSPSLFISRLATSLGLPS